MSIKTNVQIDNKSTATQVTFGRGGLQIGLGVRENNPVIVVGREFKMEGKEGFMVGDIVELIFTHPESCDMMISQLEGAKAVLATRIQKAPEAKIIGLDGKPVKKHGNE